MKATPQSMARHTGCARGDGWRGQSWGEQPSALRSKSRLPEPGGRAVGVGRHQVGGPDPDGERWRARRPSPSGVCFSAQRPEELSAHGRTRDRRSRPRQRISILPGERSAFVRELGWKARRLSVHFHQRLRRQERIAIRGRSPALSSTLNIWWRKHLATGWPMCISARADMDFLEAVFDPAPRATPGHGSLVRRAVRPDRLRRGACAFLHGEHGAPAARPAGQSQERIAASETMTVACWMAGGIDAAFSAQYRQVAPKALRNGPEFE